jgi:single-strand DNA-binding protein
MTASFNSITLVGNLTNDVELRYIPSGTAVTDISLAVNDRVKRGGEWIKETLFIDVTLWDRKAEVAKQYLRKGSSVLIQGRLKREQWEDKEGIRRTKFKVIADQMQMLDRKADSQTMGKDNQRLTRHDDAFGEGIGAEHPTANQSPPIDDSNVF